jgi:acyl carrier protein
MEREKLRGELLKLLADIAPDERLEGIRDDERLRDRLKIDSMDFLGILIEIKKRYGVEVPQPDYMKLSTLGGCLSYLEERLRDRA